MSYDKISFNAESAKKMGKEKFIKHFKLIYGLSESELSDRYNEVVPEEKKAEKSDNKD